MSNLGNKEIMAKNIQWVSMDSREIQNLRR